MRQAYKEEILATKFLIEHFVWGELGDLRNFIDELDVRAKRMKGENSEWDRKFREAWEVLEEVYAVMLDNATTVPSEAFKNLVASATGKLRLLVTAVISRDCEGGMPNKE